MDFSKLIIAGLLILFAIIYDEKKIRSFFKSLGKKSKTTHETFDEIEKELQKQYEKTEIITTKINDFCDHIVFHAHKNTKIKFDKYLNQWIISENGVEKVLCNTYNDKIL